MGRDPEEYTERAHERRPRPPEGDALSDLEPRTARDPLEPDERARLARQQGRMIASGEASKGYTVLRTPGRIAIFAGGLVGIVALALLLGIFA